MVRNDPQEVDPTHHTEIGDFNLCTYIESFDSQDVTIVDGRTGEILDYSDHYTVSVYVFWMGHPVQKHNLVSISEHDTLVDLYTYDDAVFHSQTIHDSFGNYLDGFESDYPRYRALGWALLSPPAVVAVAMAEQRAMTQASQNGNWQANQMYDYADLEPEASPMEDKTAKPPTELVEGWRKFIDSLQIDEEDGTDDNDEGRTNTD